MRGGAFPARQHLEASRADRPAATGSIPARTLFVQQSEEAIAAGAFHNDVVAVANEHVLFAHEQAFADKAGLLRRRCRRLLPEVEIVEVPASVVSLADAVRSYLFNAQLVTLPEGGMALILPEEARETPARLGLARGDGRRQRPDPPALRGRRPPVDGQWRRPGLPPAARRRRSRRRSIRASWSTRRSSTGSPRCIEAWWPERIAPDDLADPGLHGRIEAARSALLSTLDLGALA